MRIRNRLITLMLIRMRIRILIFHPDADPDQELDPGFKEKT
jgi:hypothetical protein